MRASPAVKPSSPVFHHHLRLVRLFRHKVHEVKGRDIGASEQHLSNFLPSGNLFHTGASGIGARTPDHPTHCREFGGMFWDMSLTHAESRPQAHKLGPMNYIFSSVFLCAYNDIEECSPFHSLVSAATLGDRLIRETVPGSKSPSLFYGQVGIRTQLSS